MQSAERDSFGLIARQHVAEEKRQRARELRREMTPTERRLWSALRGGQLGGSRFRRQQIIDGFIVDFYCHAARLVVEVDGGVHDDQRGHDEARDQIIADRGIRILRITNAEVIDDLTGTVQQIALAVRR